MKKKIWYLAAFFVAVFAVSCDDEYSELGVNVVGTGNYNLNREVISEMKTYSKATDAVQSNNLSLNALGVYKSDFFGTTTASFVSEIELTEADPFVGYDVVVDSVYLYIPYFYDSDETTTLDSGENVYVLDKVYNYDESEKFKLEVYENNYVLNEFDPDNNFETYQKYYNDNSDIAINAGTVLVNNSSDVSQNDQFFIDNKELYIYETDGNGVYIDEDGNALADQNDTSVRVSKEDFTPGVWLDLDTDFFKEKVLDLDASGYLANNNLFKSQFKGLYFKVTENTAGVGSMAMLDLANAQIKILFRSADETGGDLERREIELRMGYNSSSNCNSINLLSNDYSSASVYSNALLAMDGNEVNGDDVLYLKGGEGSVAYIDLFGDEDEDGNGIPDKLDELRLKKPLINEARVTFYVNETTMSGTSNPSRLYLYDAGNEAALVDYVYDSTVATDSEFNKYLYGGILDESDTNNKYLFRITDFVRSLIDADEEDLPENFRLGLSLTQSIAVSNNASVKDEIAIANNFTQSIKYVPLANVMSPLGTVLYGSQSTATDLKPTFELFYTEPN